ncbi:SpvB-domain-containing protein [Coniochaeta sp. PMI_546]|nr:SpvB-domain-containing protein [Coniochaeta sp. PMI_546]
MDGHHNSKGARGHWGRHGLASQTDPGLPSLDPHSMASQPFDSALPHPPSLSLPKGDGSIHGLGEKVDVNLTDGSGSASIPITLSKGRGKIVPDLSLQYNSHSGNGPFGLGWKLSLPQISRKTDKGLPRYEDSFADSGSDVYLLSNAEDLVPIIRRDVSGAGMYNPNGSPMFEERVQDGYSIRRYAPRVQTAFDCLERWTNLSDRDDIHWRRVSGDNQTTLFGTSSESRISDPKSEPGRSPRTFTWLLSEIFDSTGNVVVFRYRGENSDNVPSIASEAGRDDKSRSANRYLKAVQYGNVSPNRDPDTWLAIPASSLPATTWKFSVVFDYGEHDKGNPKPGDSGKWNCRVDPFSDVRAGFEVRTYRLCQRILLFHHFPELGAEETLVKSFDFIFAEHKTGACLMSASQSGYSRTSDGRGYVKKSLPPVQFEYAMFPTDEELSRITAKDINLRDLPNVPAGINGKDYQWVDLDSEGSPGILTEQSGGWFYARNTSASNTKDSKDNNPIARFGDLRLIRSRPSVSINTGSAHFGDVSGTGQTDVITMDSRSWGYYERSENTWTNHQLFRAFPNINTSDKGVKFIDLTGDGLADILVCADQVYIWYPSLGPLGYGDGKVATQPNSEDAGPIPIYGDVEGCIYLADMSGDGLVDLVRIRNHDICYWPNHGYGEFGPVIQMDNAPCFASEDLFNHGALRLADIDGSGTTDIIYMGAEGIDIYLNQSGNSFSKAKRLHSLPPANSMASVSALDILGNGTSCLVWTSPLPDAYPSFVRYVDFAQGIKPYLLKKVINNLGAETEIHYAPSTRFYLEDMDAGTPWVTHPPFPIHVVERKETIDRISGNKLTTRFRYHHGYYDTAEREFRGFARVDQWDTDHFAAMSNKNSSDIDTTWSCPPVLTKSWFNTGAYINNQGIGEKLSLEYFSAPNISTVLDGTLMPAGLIAEEQREACRALKGLVLRKEVYAEDDSDASHLPYSIQQTRYSLRALQPEQDPHGHGVYFVYAQESILFHFERMIDDPRVEHDLVLQVDPFGNVAKQVRVAYGRRAGKSTLPLLDKMRQESHLVVYTEADYTDPIDDGTTYLLPHPAEVREYELSGIKPRPGNWFQLADLIKDDFAAILQLPEASFETKTPSSGISQRRIFKRMRLLYKKDDLSAALEYRKIGHLAIMHNAYEQVFTPGLLSKIFQQSGAPLIPNVQVIVGGTDDSQAGYVDLLGDGSWWKQSDTVRYSPNPLASPADDLRSAKANFFTPRCFTDHFGNSTLVEYDTYNLFPVRVQNALGIATTTVMDYRTLEPSWLTSPNGNRTHSSSDALGLPAGLAWMGKDGERVGDDLDGFISDLSQDEIRTFFAKPSQQAAAALLGNATSRVVYDYQRYFDDPQKSTPVFSAALTRETHSSEPTPSDGLKVQVKFTYSDGFGRAIQVKDYTKPGPLAENLPVTANRWVGSGWTIYNNKGQPVRQYENFFDDTHDFKFNMKQGVSPIIMYDPMGRKVAVLRPDHTIESLAVPNAWSRVSFDVNDNTLLSDPKDDPNVGQYFKLLPAHEYMPSWHDARVSGQMGTEERSAAIKAAEHANTPSWVHLDPLGRIILDVEDNGSESFSTHVAYDIQGKALSVIDTLGRIVLQRDYSMDEGLIHEASMDAGEKWSLHDINDDLVMSWNSRGFQQRNVHDQLRRRIESWVAEEGAQEILVERITYGEAAADAIAHNLLEEIWKVEDQAGVFVNETFDFKKNLTRSSRRLWTEYKNTVDISAVPVVEPETFTTEVTYDAMSRPVRTTSPDNSMTYRVYNESQHLDKMFVNVKGEHDAETNPTTWTPIILGVDYDAMYHTTRVVHGNGLVTTRDFDTYVKRLRRVLTLDPSGVKLQDLNYTYDPHGNVTSLRDDAQKTVFFRNSRVEPLTEYTYDHTYRLVKANGREHVGQVGAGVNNLRPYGSSDAERMGLDSPTDARAMGQYLESYAYDGVGNLLSLVHESSSSNIRGWTRSYVYNEPSSIEPGKRGNRLSSTTIGSVTETYKYEGSAGKSGNMTSMSHLSSMRWNYRDQLQATSAQVVNNGTPETTYYVYDSNGMRVRKVTEREISGDASGPATRLKETIYMKDYEVFRKYNGSAEAVTLERTSLSASSEHTVVARIESRTIGDDGSPQRLVRFQMTNLLGSMCVEVDDEARIISYQEYYPFGSTSYHGVTSDFRNAAPKTYQFSGKERDEETGLYYHGARYYASWLGRWTSADPDLDEAPNLYPYASNNPVVLTDPDGRAPKKPKNSGGGGSSTRVTPTGPIGTGIHFLVLLTLAARVKMLDPRIQVFTEHPTLARGSTTPGSNRPGEIDFALLLPDKAGGFIADVTELKPKKTYDSDYNRAQGQVKRYVRRFPNRIDGRKVSQKQLGTFFINKEKKLAALGLPSLLRDIGLLDTPELKISIHLSIPKDRNGVPIPGLLTYEIDWQMKKNGPTPKMVDMQRRVAEELDKAGDKVDKVKNQGGEEKQRAPPQEEIKKLPPGVVPDGKPANDNAEEKEDEVKVPDGPKVDLPQAARSRDTEETENRGPSKGFWAGVAIGCAFGIAVILTDGGALVFAPLL